MRSNQDLEILNEKTIVDNPMEEEDEPVETEQILEEIKTLPIKIEIEDDIKPEQNHKSLEDAKLNQEQRPMSTDGHKNESATSSTNSLNTLRHSRSFDSGLPMSPEVRRRLKAISQRSPSELSLSVFDRKRSSNTTTPSPGRQSIEDLASSVENLREKLSLFPFARTGKLPFGDTEGEEMDLVPQLMSLQGGLTRSRSWQGFGAAHRAARHQAFWETRRYEQVTDKDLSLPPPPASKPPESCLSSSNSSLAENNNNMSVPPPTGRIGRIGAISRRYRPLGGSPSSSPLRYQKRSLTIPLRSPLSLPAEKSASYDSEINSESCQPETSSLEKATSLCELPSNYVSKNSDKLNEDSMLALSESLKLLSSSKTREKRNGLNNKKTNKTKFGLPGALSLDSISTTSKIVQPFSDERPREWSPKKKKRISDPKKLIENELSSSSSDEDGSSSGEEYSLECNPPQIECISELKPSDQQQQFDNIQEKEAKTVSEQTSENDETTKKLEANQQVIFRQHYLSIIQEEEEHSDANGNTPGSSRASSRPSSIYGGLPNFNATDLKEMFKGLNKDSEENNADHSQSSSPSCKSKLKKDVEEKMSTSPNSTVNSILTNQNFSFNSESSSSSSPEVVKHSPESLQEILRKLPPPPKQPPSLKPLWSPDRRKKFSPDVKTSPSQDSTIAEEHVYENSPDNDGQQRELNNLKKFNQQFRAESLRSLSSSSSSLSYDEFDQKFGLNTPPSPVKKFSFESEQIVSRSPKISPPRNTFAPYSPQVEAKISRSPKESPKTLSKELNSSENSPPKARKPQNSPKQEMEICHSPKNSSPRLAKPPSSPKKLRTPNESPPRINKSLTSPELNPPAVMTDLPNQKASSPPRIKNQEISENKSNRNELPKESNSSLVKSQLTSTLYKEENTENKIVNEEREKIKLTNNVCSSQVVNESKAHFAQTKQHHQTLHSPITEKDKYDEKVAGNSMKRNGSMQPSNEENPIPVNDFSKTNRQPENKFAQIIPSNFDQAAKRNRDSDFNSLKHLPKIDDSKPKPDLLTTGRSRTLGRGRSDRLLLDSGSSKSDSAPPKSILKETTKRFNADKNEHIEAEKQKINQTQPASEEVSLEELIKKYNGPRSSEKYSVTPIYPQQKEVFNNDSIKCEKQPPLRMRSSSCHRPNEIGSNSPRRVSGATDVTSLPVSGGSGKFSSMKELLKNVVSSQKNVQQQKMEFGQKSSARKQSGDYSKNIISIKLQILLNSHRFDFNLIHFNIFFLQYQRFQSLIQKMH